MKMIWSNSQEQMVIRDFTIDSKHYTWNDEDEVYYNDANEEDYYMTVPKSIRMKQRRK